MYPKLYGHSSSRNGKFNDGTKLSQTIRLNLTKLEHYLINTLEISGLSSGHICMHSVTRDNKQSESNRDRNVNDIG